MVKRLLQKGKTEEYIKWYFEELQERGYVSAIDTDPSPIVISDKAFITPWVSIKHVETYDLSQLQPSRP